MVMGRITIEKRTQKFIRRGKKLKSLPVDTVYRVNVGGKTKLAFRTKKEAKSYADKLRKKAGRI